MGRTAARIALLSCLAALVAATLGVSRAPSFLPPDRRPAPPAKPTPPPPSFELVAGGDVALTGGPDAATLAGVARFVRRADVGFANLEGTLATGGSPRCGGTHEDGCYVFRASPAWARTLARAGFDDLNVANNHALDFGTTGQAETLAALRAARLRFDGLPGQITVVRVRGIRVALIGCAPYGWAQSLLDTAGSAALVREAASRADVVVVYMHAGAEGNGAAHVADREETYLGERRGNPVAFAHAMVDAGADLVLASGPHVLRGLEWYRRRLIAYSLGNLAGTHTLGTVGLESESALLRVRLDRDGRLVDASLVPLAIAPSGAPALDPAGRSVALVRRLSIEDFGAAAMRVSRDGGLSPPRAALLLSRRTTS
jgi:hypothetical protein